MKNLFLELNKDNMLLYVKHFAQMCNRLWALTPALAFALHKRKAMYVLFAKSDYLNYFPNLKQSNILHLYICHNSPKPHPLEWRLGMLSEKFHLELNGDLRNIDTLGPIAFIDGWSHSCDISYIAEHKREIVELLIPDKKTISKVDRYFESYSGITVGVHVRRGDYKKYLRGRYYYDDRFYLDVIEKIQLLLEADGNKVRFLICSNESSLIPEVLTNAFIIDNTNEITDLYALSRCDYIVGPPSSYSQWASFYGDVPLFLLLNDNFHEINKDSFSKILSFNKFENGNKIVLDNEKFEYTII